MKRATITFLILSLLGLGSLSAFAAPAPITPEGTLVPDCERTNLKDNTIGQVGMDLTQITTRPCTIYDFLRMLINLIEWFFAILGAAAFLMFLYGGVLFIFSMGNPKKAEEGRGILTNTVFASVVILGAYAAVKFIAVTALGVTGGPF